MHEGVASRLAEIKASELLDDVFMQRRRLQVVDQVVIERGLRVRVRWDVLLSHLR